MELRLFLYKRKIRLKTVISEVEKFGETLYGPALSEIVNRKREAWRPEKRKIVKALLALGISQEEIDRIPDLTITPDRRLKANRTNG